MSNLTKLLEQHSSLIKSASTFKVAVDDYNRRKSLTRLIACDSLKDKCLEVAQQKENIKSLQCNLDRKVDCINKAVDIIVFDKFSEEDKVINLLETMISDDAKKIDELEADIKACGDFSDKEVNGYTYSKKDMSRAKTYTKSNFAKTFVGTNPHHKWTSMKDFNTECKHYHNYPTAQFTFKRSVDEVKEGGDKVKVGDEVKESTKRLPVYDSLSESNKRYKR